MVKGKKNTKYGLIPQEWNVLAFSKCADIRDGTHDTPQPVLSGFPLVTSKNLKNGKIDLTDTYNISSDDYAKINKRSEVEQGDILYAMIGTIGNPILIEFQPKFAIKNVALFKPYDSSIGRYLKYYLQCSYFLKEINDAQNGSNQNFISLSAFRNMQIIIPDIDERIAIAETLSDVDSLIFSLQKLIEKKKAIKQGTMQELLTGKRRLPGFCGEWGKSTFVDLFEFLPTNAFTRDQMTDTGTIQNVHYGDILTKYGFCLDMSNTVIPYLLETVSVKKYSESSYARNGDVIIADTAEDNTVGKCVELVNIRGKVLSGQHTMLCRPKVTFAPRFLGYYMNAECFHNQMLPFITGIKVSSISKANVSVLVLKYPSLVEEQQAIVQILSDMDSEIKQLEKKLAKYQQIKQGMMQELLTGRIRLVDVDSKEQSKIQAVQEKQPKAAQQESSEASLFSSPQRTG